VAAELMARKPGTKTPDDGQGGTPDQRIIREAKDRFTKCSAWEANARKKFIDDTKFVNGDSENLWQWPDSVRKSRGIGTRDERPCLTINKTAQHCLQIENDARQNKTSIKVHPTGNEATYEAAQMFEGIFRHIEYISDAQSAYVMATRHQVEGGSGYWRVVTDYVDDESFDQEIYIRPINDPLTVMMDPDYQQHDASDMRYCFIFDDMPKDEFEQAYPEYKDRIPSSPLGGTSDDWDNDDHVRVAEYFRAVKKPIKMAVITGPDGKKLTVKSSEMPKALFDVAMEDPRTKWRNLVTTEIEWFLIVGDEVAERGIWPGTTIPVVPVPGKVTVIEGQLDRKGHVRAMVDPQRMYNYHASSEVEYVALQTKSPWVAALKAIEELEIYYEVQNLVNASVLPFNHVDDDGNPIPAPTRAAPPMPSPAYLQGMETAANDMMLVSGQYQADMGAPSNEKSGKAIQERQRQGANATYHFIDNLATAIRRTGKIIIDLVPKVYNTKRTIKIMAEDGEQSDVLIDPTLKVPFTEKQIQNQEIAKQVIFNPAIGRYDIQADVGPDYATRREEAANAYTQVFATNPEAFRIAGDLWALSVDFPTADKLAERLAKMLPPELQEGGPPPEVTQLQQQIAGMHQMLQVMSQKLADKGMEEQHNDGELEVRGYEAVTKRLDMLFERLGAPADAQALEGEAILASHQTTLDMVGAEHAASLAPEPEPAAA
jgi:hypothetical protein